jgi:hypothetical protein
MGKVYVNQSELRLQLNTGVSLAGALSVLIKYLKPDETTEREFTAQVLSSSAGTIYYDFNAGELDTAGIWTFWSYVTFADSREAPGEPVRLKVWTEGT